MIVWPAPFHRQPTNFESLEEQQSSLALDKNAEEKRSLRQISKTTQVEPSPPSCEKSGKVFTFFSNFHYFHYLPPPFYKTAGEDLGQPPPCHPSHLESKRSGKVFTFNFSFTSTYFIHFYPKNKDSNKTAGEKIFLRMPWHPSHPSRQGLHDVQMMQLCIGLHAKYHEVYWLGIVGSGW